MIRNQNFIVFSDDWGRHPSSCQHIFKRIALNNRILWINTIGMRLPRLDGQDMKRGINKILSWSRHKDLQYGNLIVFSPFMLASFRSNISRKINKLLLTKTIKSQCRKYRIYQPILVTTLPIVADLIGKLGEIKSIYYCVDEFPQWLGMMKETIRKMEKDLISKVDSVLAASDKLYQSKRTNQCPTYLFSHGVDFEHFMKAGLEGTRVPADITSIKRPIIGLYGSFDERTDFNIIKHISMTHSDWSIVLIGRALTKLKEFGRLRNVFFLGPRPYQLLPNYLKSFDVCIIPYIVSDGSIFNSSPVKLREYLAAGKPIVSTPVPEVEKFNEIVKITNDKDEFVKLIELSLEENNKEKIKIRQEVVKNESWDVKAEEFSRHMEMLLKANTNKLKEIKKIGVMHLSSAVGAGGGPDKTILLSAQKIDKRRFKTTIVYLKNERDDGFDASIARKAGEMGLDFYSVSENYKIDWKSIKTVRNLLKKQQIDILHCHGYKADILGLLLSKWQKMKLVTTTHGWISNDPKERFYNWLDKKALKHYDRIITVCDQMRHYLLGMGLPSHKLMTIHNAIDKDDFSNRDCLQGLRGELNLDKGTSVIGVIGRLSREKRIELLFSISERIISEVGDVKFLITGDGPYKDNLLQCARDLGIEDRTIFLGHRDDIKRVYKTIDLLVSVSNTEGLPNVILEALACGAPVVATRVGGIEELIEDRVNGLLFSPEDTDGITNGIITLLLNRDMASSFAEEGRKFVCREFSFNERMRKMEKVYLEVMGLEK